VKLTREMDGATVRIPKATRNFYVDGHVPKPHCDDWLNQLCGDRC
jgi:hypothetical protein